VVLGKGGGELWSFIQREETGGEEGLEFVELEVWRREVSDRKR